MVGKELQEFGRLNDDEKLMVVHHGLKAGDKIQPHNHPDEVIFFTVVKGKLNVFLNGEEKHEMVPGKVLNFDGTNFISADALEDSEVFVYLIKK